MELLTYAEYKKISVGNIDESKFDKLNQRATDVINVATRQFYLRHDFESDHEWRKDAVKRAVAYQIDLFDSIGATTLEDAQRAPRAFSVGRTSITNSSTQTKEEKRSTILSADAESILSGTGLLYRGVGRR